MITFITGLLGLGKAYMQTKAEEVKEKHLTKREEARAKREANKQREQNQAQTEQSLASLDAITLKQIGWLDDFVIVVTLFPFIAGFLPFEALQQSVAAGMAALDEAPEYYQYAVGAVFIYALGFKSLIYRILIKRGF